MSAASGVLSTLTSVDADMLVTTFGTGAAGAGGRPESRLRV
jgi:hypothetical protein